MGKKQGLWTRDFTMVVLGQIVSLFGNAVLRFALPLGLSFYSFQAVGYCVDVWRGDCPPLRSPLRALLFFAFFLGKVVWFNQITSAEEKQPCRLETCYGPTARLSYCQYSLPYLLRPPAGGDIAGRLWKRLS